MLVACAAALAAADLRVGPPQAGGRELWAVVSRPDGSLLQTFLGTTTAREVRRLRASDGTTGFLWLTWDEDGAPYHSVSHDGGKAWTPRRAHRDLLLLKAGVAAPGQPMPTAELRMPAEGHLFLIQARLPWYEEMRRALSAAGCEPLAYVPENALLVQCSRLAKAEPLRKVDFVERVEPFECSYRLAPDVVQWLAEPVSSNESRRLRAIVTRPGEKEGLAVTARENGAETGATIGAGPVLALTATRDQARILACHDDLQYLDVWRPAEPGMDQVRVDSGAEWLASPEGGSYCGTGVRGEVLDFGFDADHREYADRLVAHGPFDEDPHGTASFGILFSSGAYDPKSKGMLPCGVGIAADNGPIQDGIVDRFEFTRETKEVYHASFQSNSWHQGDRRGPYDSYSYELDEIVWRLDMAILNLTGNYGREPQPNIATDGLAKNVITVGGTHPNDNLDLSDDWWCAPTVRCIIYTTPEACVARKECAWNWQLGVCVDEACASCGPTEDGRIKPDVGYWVGYEIYTTLPNDQYISTWGGTSAATPQSAGVLGLILEMWADTSQGGVNPWGHSPSGTTVFEKQPHASTLKALLINSAEQYPFSGTTHDLTRMHQGWGRPNAKNAKQRAARSYVVDETAALTQGQTFEQTIEVAPGQSELKATLAYLDPPKTLASTGRELLNDLDLRLVSPQDGSDNVSVYCGNIGLDVGVASTAAWTGPASQAPTCDAPQITGRDSLNNVENVFIREASPGQGIPSGLWQLEVKAFEVNVDGHPLVACREINLDPNNPEAGRAACEAAGCTWDGVRGVCGDATQDVVFGLVVTGGVIPTASPGVSNGLSVSRESGQLRLTWAPDCGDGTIYGVYRGDLGTGYSSIAPEPGRCDVAATTTLVSEGAGSADFFLVVPSTGSTEGSYGTDSSGTRRAPASSACHPQGQIDACAP
jgi:hypothetical protein